MGNTRKQADKNTREKKTEKKRWETLRMLRGLVDVVYKFFQLLVERVISSLHGMLFGKCIDVIFLRIF